MMENDFTFTEFLVTIVSLVSLICFFVLCSNVGEIKNKLSKKGNMPKVYALYKMGKITEAHDLLEMSFWMEMYGIDKLPESSKKRWRKLFKDYNFDRIDLDNVRIWL